MDKCIECGKKDKRAYSKNDKICWDCAFEQIREMDVLTVATSVIRVYLKQGNIITFGDADDYFIDNHNGWLTIYKGNKNRATLSLSQVESVFVE